MNMFDEKYDIRLAKPEDIPQIMDFLKNYWKEDHILSYDREYFEFEFLERDHVNFILAVDRATYELEAILGFLKSSQTKGKQDIWGSFWKVRDRQNSEKMLGMELQKRLREWIDYRYHNGIGINPKTALPLVRLFLGNTVQKMKQYYMLNDAMDDYRIAVIHHKPKQVALEGRGKLCRILSFEDLVRQFNICEEERIPYKDEWYVKKKFFQNPRRQYLAYGIYIDNAQMPEAVFIARECSANGAKAFRILDYYGRWEAFVEVGSFLKELMEKEQYEYIDFYHWGFSEEILKRAGFTLREEKDKNIIPNYFEPFVQENVDIWVHYEKDGTVFFKADGDQDRSNISR